VESDDHERGHAAEAVQKDIMAFRRRDGSC
jgi:hypothetical protein